MNAPTVTVIIRSKDRCFHHSFEGDYSESGERVGVKVVLPGIPRFEGDDDKKATALLDTLVRARMVQANRYWVTFEGESEDVQEFSIAKLRAR